MDDILSPASAPVLRTWASGDPLLAFDFDGTLAPIVADPARVSMRRTTRTLFARLSFYYECAVISGRSLSEVERHLDGLCGVHVVGNHGMEWPGESSTNARFTQLTRSWLSDLARDLSALSGVRIENKLLTLSIHYRSAPDPDAALSAIRKVVSGLPAARIEEGKRVVNVLPADAPDKRVALERLMSKTDCATAMFVGDDINDEPVFADCDRERVLSIRVGRDESSHARFFLRAQADLDELLARILRIYEDRLRRP